MENGAPSPELRAPLASRDGSLAAPPAWSPWRLVVFRFGFVYWILFGLPVITNQVELFGEFGKRYGDGVNALGAWVGQHVLRIGYPIGTAENGSGDRTVDYVNLFCFAAIALVTTVVWSIVGRRARQHDRLREVLRVFVRYTLALIMLGYGVIKLFHGQFSPPHDYRLLQPYGQSSPMGLLWTFMGASPAYVVFAGAGETLGAVLLLFRRTMALGALVLAAVLSNVVMMNFCYDVPVKINSTHYLVMCIFVLLPYLRRLGDVLLFNRASEPVETRLELPRRWMRVARRIIKYGVIGATLLILGMQVSETPAETPSSAAANPWPSGTFTVKSFSRHPPEAPAIPTDSTRWKRVKFQWSEHKLYFRWRNMDESFGDLYTVAVDETKHTMTFTPDGKEKAGPTFVLTFVRRDADHLGLEGVIDKDAVAVELEYLDTSKMLLMSRGFHWINEMPFNR